MSVRSLLIGFKEKIEGFVMLDNRVVDRILHLRCPLILLFKHNSILRPLLRRVRIIVRFEKL